LARQIVLKPSPADPVVLASYENGLDSFETKAFTQLQNAAFRFVNNNNKLPHKNDWKELIKNADLKKIVSDAAREYQTIARKGGKQSKTILKREAKMAGLLTYLADNYPTALNGIVLTTVSNNNNQNVRPASKIFSKLTKNNFDPLANFDPESQLAVLSPIGVVDLYREYFFELDSFLGPPVGHVWISPGSTLELYEIHTRKVIQEKQIEQAIEITSKSETEMIDQDEISTAVSEENSRNINLGISASGGINFGNSNVATGHIGASANFSIGFTTSKSQEASHKHSRQQTERLSNEIRRNYKTTFKTIVETQDTSSRRYVLENSTDKLVNFELRRKMRRVGVQLQHIGKQLCWQVFVDNPGSRLGLSQLVHVAEPEDRSPEPIPGDVIPSLESKTHTFAYTFPFMPITPSATDDGADEDYDSQGIDDDEYGEEGDDQGRIVNEVPIKAEGSPGVGYKLTSVQIIGQNATGDGDGNWYANPRIPEDSINEEEGTFKLHLDYVNFDDNSGIIFTIQVMWSPPGPDEATKEAQDLKQPTLTEAQIRAQHLAAVKLVRERINFASNVRIRPSKDLRDEERTIIYRRLIKMLTNIENLSQQYHLMAELIRTIFDIDNMLYFVAPEWWRPQMRSRSLQNVEVKEYTLTSEDKITWGGQRVYGGPFPGLLRPNYYITEASEPARMGSSLGWILQLDGDAHRNIFLNAPWVKAVIPVRPGREKAAINWLKKAEVEGTDGLTSKYGGDHMDLDPDHNTIEDALDKLATEISKLSTDINNTLKTEKVFETGFDPLEGGFRASGIPFDIFDQWIEILPTDQIVAVEYEPDVE
jgi:hypothetical protein